MDWSSFLGSVWSWLAGAIGIVGAIVLYFFGDSFKKALSPHTDAFARLTVSKTGLKPLPDETAGLPVAEEPPTPVPDSTEKVDPRRQWPGRPLHDPLFEFPERCRWERLIEFLGVDWRVVHAYGYIIHHPEPRCPACQDDMEVEEVELRDGGGPGTSFACANPECGFATVVPVPPTALAREVGERIEGQLRREARTS